MSKIVFWSPLHSQGQTSNLHIIALIMSLLHKKKILMMQTHFSMNNLEGPLVGKSIDISKRANYSIFHDIGIDAAVMYSQTNRLMGNMLESCCITFPNTSLLLLPGTETKNRETFDRDTCKAVCNMVHHAEDYVDLIMIDANSGNDELSFKLISLADIIIINLTQSRHVLHKFLSDYRDKFSDYSKLFFLFGNYDKNAAYNIYNCRRRYKNYINRDNSAVIPYLTKYKDAQNEGEVLAMVKEGLNICNASDMDKIKEIIKRKLKLSRYQGEDMDYFFYQACKSVTKILNALNMEESKSQLKRSRAWG